jgi:hypothetical protein
MLLAMHMLALGVACMVFVWIVILQRRYRATAKPLDPPDEFPSAYKAAMPRPASWLAIRSIEPEVVRTALVDKSEFFISPRVNNWVVVTGPGLPNPSENVDGCFRFLTDLSRQLGHVQFFYVEKFSAHHAWARLDEGCVTRAYAWAGETIWNQGLKTLGETELGLKCFDYGESHSIEPWTTNDNAVANVEKIPLLATRWSIDPAILSRVDGITGESSRLY